MSLFYDRISILACDGCGLKFGHDKHFRDAVAIRKIAGTKGWTFPNRVTAAGKVSPRTNDVCPACSPSWSPLLAKKTNTRDISKSQQRAKRALMKARAGKP